MRAFAFAFALSAFASPLAAQSDLIGPCPEDSPDRAAAQAALAAFDAQIEGADANTDPDVLLAAFHELLRGNCFRILTEVRRPNPVGVVSFQNWWNRGGEEWLGSALGEPRVLTLPPEPIPTLSLEAAPTNDPLRSLLCPAGDASCGAATRGWRIRAEAAFFAHAARGMGMGGANEVANRLRQELSECADRGRSESGPNRYMRWSRCVDATLPTVTALPLGELRAPTDGWLVVRGRRGHYQFCEEVRAYDLATGAAYIARECSQLFQNIGTTSQAAPAEGGHVPIEAIREAAWIMLIGDRVTDVRRLLHRMPLPNGIRRRLPASSGYGFGRGGGGGWGSSAQTRLHWSWVSGRTVRASGTITWPNSSRAAEEHADDLLRIAEAALDTTCAPTALPAQLALNDDQSGVSRVDATPQARAVTQTSLETRLRRIRVRRCRRGR